MHHENLILYFYYYLLFLLTLPQSLVAKDKNSLFTLNGKLVPQGGSQG